MPFCAVICEFDPFTNGHAYLLEQAHCLGQPVLCVMSGNFTQRGTPSCADKFTRAAMALACGADAVAELAPPFAVSNAERFALGGVLTARACGADTLVFGAETADDELLSVIADISLEEPEAVRTALRTRLDSGYSFARARHEALLIGLAERLDPSRLAVAEAALLSPNCVLGIEYIKAIRRLAPDMRFIPVLRIGSGHNSDALSDKPCASFIREQLSLGSCVKGMMPDAAFALLSDFMHGQGGIVRRDALDGVLLYSLRNGVDPDTADAPFELRQSLGKNALRASSADELISLCTNKTYSSARVRRCAASVMLKLTEELFDKCLSQNARPLLLGAKSEAILSLLGSSVITRANEFDCGGAAMQSILYADSVYTLALKSHDSIAFSYQKRFSF